MIKNIRNLWQTLKKSWEKQIRESGTKLYSLINFKWIIMN